MLAISVNDNMIRSAARKPLNDALIEPIRYFLADQSVQRSYLDSGLSHGADLSRPDQNAAIV